MAHPALATIWRHRNFTRLLPASLAQSSGIAAQVLSSRFFAIIGIVRLLGNGIRARLGCERHSWVKFERRNGAFGKSDIEGKVARVAARKRGRDRVSSEREHRVKTFEVRSSDFKYDSLFLSRIVSGLRCMSRTTVAAGVSPANGANGMSDIEGKAAREAASECGQGASFKNL